MKWIWLLLVFPSLAFAAEDCSMVSGTCKEVCAADEIAEKGAFLDCSDKQECCVKNAAYSSGDNNLPTESRERDQKSQTDK